MKKLTCVRCHEKWGVSAKKKKYKNYICPDCIKKDRLR